MFNPDHIYRLRDGDMTLASASSLADARKLAGHLFEVRPNLVLVDVYAWSYDAKRQHGGFSFILAYESPNADLILEQQEKRAA